ncbi:hypothetical protein [Pedobacter sp. L105]|uniref:hypothetical protein n=1 Tax=Pedobacter sp. L105 TaxID=1641871 RepID=UPI00131AF0D7|nr:hypothetical protein [Pedobacter sp. L105]
MKRYFLLILLLVSLSGYAQNTINNYKYVLVPEQFSFLKQKDQYKLNTLTKRLLEDKGFTVYFDNSDVPGEISSNKCIALNAEVVGKSTMFSTSLTLILKDCKGNIIFKGKEGKSREKDYDVSYNLALRDAFNSLNAVPYAYAPSTDTRDQQPVATASVPAIASAPVTTSVPATASASASASVPVTANVAVPSNMYAAKVIATETGQTAGTLYAQPTATGYQLIDTQPKIRLTLSKTSVQDYFIADNGVANGIVFKRNENWFFEYYTNGKLVAEKLLIKF